MMRDASQQSTVNNAPERLVQIRIVTLVMPIELLATVGRTGIPIQATLFT